MMRRLSHMGWLGLLLVSRLLWADVLLPGSFYVGDNSSDGLLPTRQVQQVAGRFVPVDPIHLSLSAPLTISDIRLENASGLDAGMNVVIWNSSGTVLFDRVANMNTPDRIGASVALPAGEYQMAVWGGCFRNGVYQGRFQATCSDWDDFRFDGVRLVANGGTDALHFSERTHIGDNTDASRWYPPAAQGRYVQFLFELPHKSRLNNLTLYNLRDWGVSNGSRIFIRPQGGSDAPLVFYFSQNGDVDWPINAELDAGAYELWVETLAAGDQDDIAWDDIILRYTPSVAPYDFSSTCQQAFPYPAQGRTSNSTIDLGNKNATAGRIWGTQGGRLGYANSGHIKNSNDQNCDGGVCVPAGNSKVLTLPAFPPLNTGPDLSVGSGEYRRLDASAGLKFGTITVNNQGRLDVTTPGLSIKQMNLLGGRQGSGYSVKLAAGEYWIEDLVMKPDTRIELAGPVKLYVRHIKLESASLLNSPEVKSAGDINRLLLVVYNTLDMRDGATLSGLVYQADAQSQDELYLQPGAYIFGRVSSESLKLGDQAVIDSRGYECGSSPPDIDHYELSYSSTSLTCEPANVQLKACANADCSTLYQAGASVTLVPAQGWSSNPVALAASGSRTLTLQRYQAGSLPLALSSALPAAPLRCIKDGVVDPGCTLDFVDAALQFNVPTFYAGDAGLTTIRAIKSSDAGATKVCTPMLTGQQSLQFGYTRVVAEPASSALPAVNGTALAPSAQVPVTFDSNGVGQLAVTYPDAGVLRLEAAFQKSDATGTLRLGGSDTFAVIPSAIQLRSQDQPACSGSDDASYLANCPVYRKAGEAFTLQARALNRQEALTPGFAATSLPLQWARLAPQSGVNGMPTPASLAVAAGVASSRAQWDEVGVVRVGVTDFVPYPAFQDETPQLKVPLRWSNPIGRFIPADFNLTRATVAPACGDFSYMGQPFTVAFEVVARNMAGNQTRNYRGVFAKGGAYITSANNRDGKPLTSRLKDNGVLPGLTWDEGMSAFSGSSWFARLSASQPDGPYRALQLGLSMQDNDGERTLIANPDFSDGVAGGCSGGACTARLLNSVPMQLYFGRLLAGTEAGLASAPLAIPLQLQYYEAGNWQRNRLDQCTRLSLAGAGVSFLNPDQRFDAASRDLDLGAGRKIRLGLGSASPGGEAAQAQDGEILFHFARPQIAVRIPYRVELAKQPAQPSAPLWLADPQTLQGEAIFGSTRGNDRIIYRRELLP